MHRAVSTTQLTITQPEQTYKYNKRKNQTIKTQLKTNSITATAAATTIKTTKTRNKTTKTIIIKITIKIKQ
jgi:hypothetical protein